MYKLKYDFRQYNNVIATYIDVLINNSMAIFQQQMRDYREPFDDGYGQR